MLCTGDRSYRSVKLFWPVYYIFGEKYGPRKLEFWYRGSFCTTVLPTLLASSSKPDVRDRKHENVRIPFSIFLNPPENHFSDWANIEWVLKWHFFLQRPLPGHTSARIRGKISDRIKLLKKWLINTAVQLPTAGCDRLHSACCERTPLRQSIGWSVKVYRMVESVRVQQL